MAGRRLSAEDLTSLRKQASLEQGRLFFQERFGAPRVSPVQQVLLHKAASTDRELLSIAASVRPDNPLAVYEELGGRYNFGKSEG